MWNILLVLLPALACSSSYIIEPEDEILKSYKSTTTRALLTPEQEEFLMELLAADDALIAEATNRGIVDDILQALAGVGMGNIRVNVIGGGNPQPAAQPAGSIPSLTLPTFTLVTTTTTQQQAAAPAAAPSTSLYNFTSVPAGQTVTSVPIIIAAPPATGAPIPGFPIGNAPQQQQQQQQVNSTTFGGNNNHLFSTISNVISNSNRRNVTGIVDESLRIATPAPIREFVTGILGVVYCNGIRRLLGRC